MLLVTRLLRGEEDLGRVELLLVGPARGASRATTLLLLVVMAGCRAVGAAVAAALVATGADAGGSVVFGVGLAGFASPRSRGRRP